MFHINGAGLAEEQLKNLTGATERIEKGKRKNVHVTKTESR